MSPASSNGERSAMLWSTTAAGTISQMARGFCSFFTRSANDDAPAAFSLTRSLTACAERSYTTHWWPFLMSRRTMLAPIRPSPIMPSCIVVLTSWLEPLLGESLRTGVPCRPPRVAITGVSCRAFHLPVTPDQVVGGAVVLECGRCRVFELRDDRLCQRLAQFNAPLVERVDVPDNSLGADDMLVERDQLAQRLGCQPVRQNGVGWPVAFKHAVQHEPVRRAFRLDLLGCLAKCQRLGLSQDICQQHVVVRAQWRQGVSKGNEITGNQPRALVNQLVKRMLAVGARLTPVDGTGVAGHGRAVERDGLAVALHRQLLEIGREALEVILVGQHGHGLCAEEVVVPER